MMLIRAMALCAGVAVFSLSATVDAQTLEDTLVKAYDGNPNLRAARARVRSTDEGVAQALSNWRPTVSVEGSYAWDRSDGRSSENVNRNVVISNPATGSLTVTQNIYRGGRTIASTETAEFNVLADRAFLASTEQTVLLSAATAYADVVQNQAVLELNQNNERVLERQLEATRDRFQVGEVTRTDVSQAESRLSQARADRIQAEGNLTDSRAAYENVVGEKPGLLKAATPLQDIPATLNDAVRRARSNDYDVIRTRNVENAARSTVRTIIGELLPLVTVNGELLKNKETVSRSSDRETVAVKAQVSMPLYASGSVTSRVRQAKQVQAQRRDEYNQAVRKAVENATAAWQSLSTARAQIRAFSDQVHAAEIALAGVREEANVGSRTVLDVLNAEQELLNARVSLVRAQRDDLVATYQIRQAVGSLTARDLGLPVLYYDVEKHYRDVRGKWWGLEASDGR